MKLEKKIQPKCKWACSLIRDQHFRSSPPSHCFCSAEYVVGSVCKTTHNLSLWISRLLKKYMQSMLNNDSKDSSPVKQLQEFMDHIFTKTNCSYNLEPVLGWNLNADRRVRYSHGILAVRSNELFKLVFFVGQLSSSCSKLLITISLL